MPLMPMIMDDFLLQELHQPFKTLEPNFGVGLFDDFFHPHHSVGPMRGGYYRPWHYQQRRRNNLCNIKDDKDYFKVNLDVQQFAPEDITVKTVDGFVVVEGKHEEREDAHGFITRQFQRRYKLPKECLPDLVKSSLSSDGFLTVTAPKKPLPLPAPNERVVQIIQTNVPAMKASHKAIKLDH